MKLRMLQALCASNAPIIFIYIYTLRAAKHRRSRRKLPRAAKHRLSHSESALRLAVAYERGNPE